MATETAESASKRPASLRSWLIYGLMALATVALFLLIRSQGEGFAVTAPAVQAAAPLTGGGTFLHLLLALAAIIVLGRLLSRLFAHLSQPPVIGEVVAGILLGPSLVGPRLSALVLPPSVGPYLGVIAQLGVVLYMFIVGVELNPALLKRRAQATLIISHTSIFLPFLMGAGLALYLYPRYSSGSVSFTSFALFLGVAMAITAFPVLARILTDYRIARTRLGVLALSCAAIGDVTAWCLLAFVIGVAKAEMGQGLYVAAGALGYILLMYLAGRPLMGWITRHYERQTDTAEFAVTLIFVALLLSALATEAIGIHAIFGAFLLGCVIPWDSAVARTLLHRLESVVTVLLLPAFFAYTGMRTRLDLLTQPSDWLICGMIVLVATLGKTGGAFAAARLTGLGSRNAAMLGTLMNTRGLMELIVLNVGLELRVITPALFSIMVLMALVTTALTSPVLRYLRARPVPAGETDMLADQLAGEESIEGF
ncbi:MAG TPA: cation:proton antiporter [Gammaproteobacteria bacterium]|nr:cation:proton antiporter [Gammaproteobacteria bacterium]